LGHEIVLIARAEAALMAEGFDIFSPPPCDKDVKSHVERLGSIETKIAPIFSRIAAVASLRSNVSFIVLSRAGW
jgi:hypothetical protein